MAIKASASITLSAVRDLAACTRYYLLQSSTLSPPAKPTANPPGGSWVTTEPSYTSGSTNSLYLCDLNVFSDGDYAYSDVSLSSSYEAAKAAYNKAQAAQDAASGANAQEQTIYISKATGTASVAATTTWVTNTAGGQNTWTLKRPVYNGGYPVLFVATQRKTVGGTVTCTTPLKDDTTTVIDGGHITTGTIDASRVTVTNLDADNITAGTLKANRIALYSYDSPFLIPDENDAGTLFPGQSVADGWIVGNGSYVKVLQMEDATEHRGKTLRLSFVYPGTSGSGAPSGSFVYGIGGGQETTTGFPAQRTYGQTDSSGALIGPTSINDGIKYTVSFTIPQEATDLLVTANVPKVKAIAANFAINALFPFGYGSNVSIDGNGIQSGKFVVDRTGNVTSAGFSTFEGQVEMTGGLTVDGKVINDMATITYGTCSTAASAQVKAVALVNGNWQLKVGSVIGVRFTNTNTYSATASAPCKLNVNSTGDKQIYYNNSATPTGTNTLAFGYANRIVYYMYDGTYWVFVGASASSVSDTYNRLRHQNVVKAAAAITANTLICGTASGYKKLAGGVTFDIQYPILYAASAISSGGTSDNVYLALNGVSLRNNTSSAWTGTQYSMAYVKGTLSGSTFTVHSSVITTAVSTSADGFVYIPIGYMYSTYQVYFCYRPEMYAYINGAFQRVTPGALNAVAGVKGSAESSYRTGNVNLTAANVGARPNVAPVSGAWFNGTPIVGSDGVMEIGKYIDFHDENASTDDYTVRLSVDSSGKLFANGNPVPTISTTAVVGTTDGNGNISLDLPEESIILTCYALSWIVTPWVSGSDRKWHARVTGVTGSAAASQSVSIAIKYYTP